MCARATQRRAPGGVVPHRWAGLICAIAGLCGAAAATGDSTLDRSVVEGPLAPRDYWLFESDPVRPLALSHDGRRLYVANIPDGRLEVFAVTGLGITHLGAVPVGLEPVAVAVSPDDRQVWVVNHLSDSVSVVNVAATPPYVEETLLVGDEPRDIVFAGPDFGRVFVTTAHRGQNHPLDPQLTTPSVGRADVWVFEAADTGAGPGGTPLAIVTLFGDTPRALAASPDGSRVYAAVFRSGNRTTTLSPATIVNFPKPPPNDSADGVPEPTTGIIVRQIDGVWQDELGRNYNSVVGLSLPDRDVFEIDALAPSPVQVDAFDTVGTTLFDMAVNPVNGDVYVSNTDARNDVRFSGDSARASSTVRGHLADHRVTVIHDREPVYRDLNPHLDYTPDSATPEVRAASLSMPMGLAVSRDGSTLYVAAYGSAAIAVYDTEKFAGQGAGPAQTGRIELAGGGPAGVVLDEDRGWLYTLTRFDDTVRVIDLASRAEVQNVALFNPEPGSVTLGRPFLYDARLTSGYGNDSCHTCHLFGDNDALAWDLGDPDGTVKPIPNAYNPASAGNPGLGHTFHPLKGPMTTQSMRGLPRHGPQHWRGDRTGTHPQGGETLEEAAFKEFNEAFDVLQGLDGGIADADMQAFTDFAMQLTYPPNPIRNLDGSRTPVQQAGFDLFVNGVLRADGNLEVCVTCHALDPAAGVFGTDGTMAFNNQPGEKDFKIPHFRDQYQKVGMFTSNTAFRRPQVRGFAMNHNGATSINNTFAEFGVSADKTEALKQYLFAFPSESAPVMGQQLTLDRDRFDGRESRLDLLVDQAEVTRPFPGCDLVVHGADAGGPHGWTFDRAAAAFRPDDGGPGLDRAQMTAMLRAASQPYTLTCAPWGSGSRLGRDRDRDGVGDAAEFAQGSDPGDPASSAFRAASGLWWNPARAGQGFDLQHAGSLLALTWFTYDAAGQPTWYQAVAAAGQHWQADLLRFEWDSGAGAAVQAKVGQATMDFEDARHGRLDWSIAEQAGSQPIERFGFDARPTALPFTGLWYDPVEPGYGLTVDSQGETRVAVLYFYDRDRQPRWVLVQQPNLLDSTGTAITVTGPCPWCDYRPQEESDGGTIRLDFDSLQSAGGDIDVYFHDPELDGWRRTGVALQRLTEPYLLPDF